MSIVNVLELSPLLCNCPFSSVVLYSLRSVQSWLVTEMSRNWLNSRGWFSNAIGSQMKWNQRGNEVATCYAWTIIGRVAFGRRNVKFSLLSRQLVDWWSRCRGHGSEVRCGSSAHIHIKWFAFVLATGHWNALKTGAHRGVLAVFWSRDTALIPFTWRFFFYAEASSRCSSIRRVFHFFIPSRTTY